MIDILFNELTTWFAVGIYARLALWAVCTRLLVRILFEQRAGREARAQGTGE